MLNIKKEYPFSKVGMDEIVGLEDAMRKVFKPIETTLLDKMYWCRGDEDGIVHKAEYKSRDGFIPHSHNCGGLKIVQVVPKCEEYEFGFLEFGEWDGEHYCEDTDNCECHYDCDGEYDALLDIWFKFEGLDEETGELKFYLVLSGGNNDAPYFRNQPTLFEAEFTCKSIAGLNRAASKHIKALLKLIK